MSNVAKGETRKSLSPETDMKQSCGESRNDTENCATVLVFLIQIDLKSIKINCSNPTALFCIQNVLETIMLKLYEEKQNELECAQSVRVWSEMHTAE